MLSSFVTAGGGDAANGPVPLAAFSKSGAYGTGSWTDTPPRLGAAERRAAFLVNVLSRRELAKF